MKAALAQISPLFGDIRENLDLHLKFIEKARRRKADLIIFPELSLTGYTLMDLVPEMAIEPARHPLFRKLVAASRSIDIVTGFLEEKERGLFYNSAAYLAGGKIVHLHRKVFLPTGGMFEEAKFFARGRHFRTFVTSFGKVGLMICRDFLSYAAGYLLFADGADLIIVVSAAPGRGVAGSDRFATSRMWELMGETISFFSTAFVLYCNRVGVEDGKTFAGGSFIFSPAGRRLAKAAEVDEEMVIADLRLEDIRQARKKWTFKRDDQPEVILHALERIVRDDED
ncbi:MAG: carbon-nitrogen hydrolase [Candidatus Aminicenantes bacterium]|nr:carbon-nitrogen hydrolase [Candidatus Aminicenantes bacterium]